MNDDGLVRYLPLSLEDLGLGDSKKKKITSPGVNELLCGSDFITGRLHPKLTSEGEKVLLRTGKNEESIVPGTCKALRQRMRDGKAMPKTTRENEPKLPRQGKLFSSLEDEEAPVPFDPA